MQEVFTGTGSCILAWSGSHWLVNRWPRWPPSGGGPGSYLTVDRFLAAFDSDATGAGRRHQGSGHGMAGKTRDSLEEAEQVAGPQRALLRHYAKSRAGWGCGGGTRGCTDGPAVSVPSLTPRREAGFETHLELRLEVTAIPDCRRCC